MTSELVQTVPAAPVFASPVWSEGWYLVPSEVMWRDLDAIGHVNNAVYFTFFEWARTRYWLDLNGTSGVEAVDFIVARAECDFRLQLGMGERIVIAVRISEMRRSSFDFVYEIRKEIGSEVAATGKVVVVLYAWDTKKPVPIPERLRERVRSFQVDGGRGYAVGTGSDPSGSSA